MNYYPVVSLALVAARQNFRLGIYLHCWIFVTANVAEEGCKIHQGSWTNGLEVNKDTLLHAAALHCEELSANTHLTI